jgi:hypothetical protein
MKKIVYLLVLFFLFIGNSYAFSIDVDKINIRGKSTDIINNLDISYRIETPLFNNQIINDEGIAEYSKEILKISFDDISLEKKKSQLIDYMHMSSTNGFDTLNGTLFLDFYLQDIDSKNVEIEYIKDIKTIVFNENDRMVFIYIDDALVDGKKQDIVVTYWLKSNDGETFNLYYPWVTFDDNLDSYFKKLIDNEINGSVIGGTYNKMSITDNEMSVNDDLLISLYEQNKNSVVQITGMNESGSNAYASGFFLREGVVVTTWSVFLQFLTQSNYIYVNDVNGNTYDVMGVIAADANYDVVVLKLSQEVGQRVVFGSSDYINTGDKLFTINSKINSGFVINYGTNLSVKNGRFENMFLINESDVGGALFNSNGEVVAFNVADQLYSELSYANSVEYLRDLQSILVNTGFSSVRYVLLDTFKQNYYLDIYEEEIINNVSSDMLKKYRKIGNLEENITLKLVKSSYVDGVLSLRYKNNVSNMLNSIYLVSNFSDELVNQGFTRIYSDEYKQIYTNKEYKVVIKDSLDYLIILIMEI